MKELIYLDTSFLHSFIAQSQGGLPTTTSTELQEQVSQTSNSGTGYSSRSFTQMEADTGSLSIPGIIKSPSGKMRVRIQPGKTSSESISLTDLESGKEIISKQLHDNALETFESFMTSENELYSINEDNLEGKFVKVSATFKIIDFKYLNKILQTDALSKLMFYKQDEEFQKLKDEVNSGNSQERAIKKTALQQVESQIKQAKQQMKSNLEFAEQALIYLNDILPTEAFLIIDNTIAPLKKEFLRENSNELMFKYGGTESKLKINMVGKVTREINDIEMPNFNRDPFFELPKIITAILGPFGVVKAGDLIVTPIAIYFE